MPLAIGFFILFMVTSLIIFYKDCDSFVEYLFSTIVGVVLSAFVAFLIMFIICGIVIFVEPATYSAKTTQTYSITALNDNFSSYVGRYYTEDGLYYSFLYQTDKGITAKSIEANQSYIKNTNDDPYIEENKIRFKNPVLNFLLGPRSVEYTIYIPEDSFIQENYVIDLE